MGLWPATTALDHSKLQGPILSAAAPHPGKTSAILLGKKRRKDIGPCAQPFAFQESLERMAKAPLQRTLNTSEAAIFT